MAELACGIGSHGKGLFLLGWPRSGKTISQGGRTLTFLLLVGGVMLSPAEGVLAFPGFDERPGSRQWGIFGAPSFIPMAYTLTGCSRGNCSAEHPCCWHSHSCNKPGCWPISQIFHALNLPKTSASESMQLPLCGFGILD